MVIDGMDVPDDGAGAVDHVAELLAHGVVLDTSVALLPSVAVHDA